AAQTGSLPAYPARVCGIGVEFKLSRGAQKVGYGKAWTSLDGTPGSCLSTPRAERNRAAPNLGARLKARSEIPGRLLNHFQSSAIKKSAGAERGGELSAGRTADKIYNISTAFETQGIIE
ncbi:MAG TPA: hypothetical protein VFW23_08145, partial [Tepidisphaeraceae bacterium]|nr:hypothetical protein [Tepidisphaeraceae bacterium]